MKIARIHTLLLTVTCLFIVLVIFSCKKENSGTLAPQDEEQANVSATQSDAEAENVFDGVFNDVLGVNKDVALGGTGIFGRNGATGYEPSYSNGRLVSTTQLPSCLTVTIEHTTANTFPIQIILDFGHTGCLANDGHFRKGKIIITYSNRLLYPGASATAAFQDFYIDSISVENWSTLKISNVGTQDKLQFQVDIDTRLSKPNGNYSEWHSSKTIKQTLGSATSSPLDDVFAIEGDATGKVRSHDIIVAWEAKVTKPLVKKFSCRWISDGTVNIRRANLSSNSQWVGALDYGYRYGNCDNKALLAINNQTYEITLR
jgi:hypothetical protein